MNIYLDQKPFNFDGSSRCETFEELCRQISDHLSAEGKGIGSVRVDGVEVDCSAPPSGEALHESAKIEVTTCQIQAIVANALQEHVDLAERLAGEFLEFSTDTLLMQPQENFDKWRSLLESLKPLIGFIPKFMLLQPLSQVESPELSEARLLTFIEEIHGHVEAARRALETSDIVEFSDILELRLAPWLKQFVSLSQTLGRRLTGSPWGMCPAS